MNAMTHTTRRSAPGRDAPAHAGRADQVLAKVRRRQLELALQGRVFDSSRYARWAQIVRRQTA